MYGALWRLIPGRLWVRILLVIVLVAVVLLALDLWVFPWANGFINVNPVTVDN
jgi:hypothetical protein